MNNKKTRLAFSLIELSVVIIVIGLLVLGITKGSRIIREAKIKSARALTASSPVVSTEGLTLWLETSGDKSLQNSGGSYNPNDGDAIATWYDINPHSTDRLQATESTNRPSFEIDGINGLPTLLFSCPSGASASCPKLSISFNNILNTANHTIFIVTNTTSMVSTYSAVLIFSVGGSNGYSIFKGSSMLWQIKNYSVGLVAQAAATYGSNSPIILTFTRDDTKNNVYQNNSAASSTTIGYTAATSGSFVIGRNNVNEGYNGYISEIIMFNKVLKNSEIAAINNYLSVKYGIKIS